MSISFTPWPADLATRYRKKGYWQDKPLTAISERHRQSDHPAIIDQVQTLSYRQLATYSDQLAAQLQARGLTTGDTALVQLSNCCEFYIVFFALLKLGIAPVNALFSHQQSELTAYATQIRPRLLIADREHPVFTDNRFLEQLHAQCPELEQTLWHHPFADDSGLHALFTQHDETFTPTPSSPDNVAFFQLSGGSTGTPKLIPRTHNDYYYSIVASVEICQFTAQTRYLCALPIAHNYPMSSPGILGVLYAGGVSVLAADPSPTTCFTLIADHQINVTALVPPAVSLWLQSIREWDCAEQLSSLRLLQVGGAKLSESLAARIPAEIGCQLQQVFGMAEGLVNYTRLDDDLQTILTTQGRPISPDDEVWVADTQGNPLPPNTTGRLMTRGPYTFRGYYNSPEHNATCFDQQGFYCSGDLISISEQGYITVQGREKDQINRGGEKIAAEEVENLLQRHPDIIHAALVSMNDELLGEKSCAYIVAKQPLKAVQLRRHLREQGIAEFKLPDRFVFTEMLPLTPVGKVDKKQLRQQLIDDNKNKA
ncbi:(2,3-dihydroxybenzoyl)adenylate synthase [Rosenbergiella australiborealis]|uniref:(2,3-dihydroxybenzoyl)adenylate synthase n=1 Tax=Rosenbergiella australiborealis TaxID=1544696 RepID=A0ABS5T275_9GAMM|nr:(2,3-dihydroxybenzoyl)adenylate synthase [Rosenbergiella australiborealis]MBT0725853.1 (2,3-dihydroxybenzoyl)adenylate synthase [Rosenbergiella australiborealis]